MTPTRTILIALGALAALATTAPAYAEDRGGRDQQQHVDHGHGREARDNYDRGHRDEGHREDARRDEGWHREEGWRRDEGWNRGPRPYAYGPPPVVYQQPYAPPPVVFGFSFGG